MIRAWTAELSDDDEESDDDGDGVGELDGVDNGDGVDGDGAGTNANGFNGTGDSEDDGMVRILLEFVGLGGLLGTLSALLLLRVRSGEATDGCL